MKCSKTLQQQIASGRWLVPIAPAGWNSAFECKQTSSVSGQHTASEQRWCSWKKKNKQQNHNQKKPHQTNQRNQNSFYVHCICRCVSEWLLACPVQWHRWYSPFFYRNSDEHILVWLVERRVFWLLGTPCIWNAENFKRNNKLPPSLWGSKVLAWVTSRDWNRTVIALHGTGKPLAFALTPAHKQPLIQVWDRWNLKETRKKKKGKFPGVFILLECLDKRLVRTSRHICFYFF